MRTDFPCKLCDFTRLLHPCVVLPEPSQGIGIARKFLLKCERAAFVINRQRRAPRCVNAEPYNSMRCESTDGFLRPGKSLLHALLSSLHVVGGWRAREVRIIGKDNPLAAALVVPYRRSDLLAIRHVNDKCTNRIRPEIQTNGISISHIVYLLFQLAREIEISHENQE